MILSIIATIIVTAFWYGSLTYFQAIGLGAIPLLLVASAVNIAFAAVAIILLGKINRINGFKHIFKTKGIKKSLIALIPVAAFFAFGILSSTGGFAPVNTEIFPIAAFFQMTVALVQNVLFRGLLVAAILIKFSSTESDRVKSIFIASALYLIIYIPMSIMGGGLGLMQLINTFVVGVGFCSAYLYSKNLLGLVLVQGIASILTSAVTFHNGANYAQSSPLLIIVWIIIMVAIVAFGIIFSRRAEPFYPN